MMIKKVVLENSIANRILNIIHDKLMTSIREHQSGNRVVSEDTANHI